MTYLGSKIKRPQGEGNWPQKTETIQPGTFFVYVPKPLALRPIRWLYLKKKQKNDNRINKNKQKPHQLLISQTKRGDDMHLDPLYLEP